MKPASVCRCNGKCDGSCLRWPIKRAAVAIVAAIALTACASAVAPNAPYVEIDCGSLSGSGAMQIDIGGVKYLGRIDCGTRI